MLKRFIMTMVAFIAALLAPAAVLPAHAQKIIKINLAHAGDPVHPWHIAAKQFSDEVKEQSDGILQVQIYTAGQMGSDREVLESTQSGALQMSAISTMAMSGFEPSLQIFDLPYLMPNYEFAYKVLDGEIGRKVAENLKSKGIRNLVYWENDYRQLSNSKKPIASVKDMAGLKIRVPETPILIGWLEALGAIPTPIAYTELYTSLQQGVVDGQDNGILLMHSAKYHEAQKYYTLTNHIYAPVAFLINERFFNRLSAEHQLIIKTAAERARDYQRKLNNDLRTARLQEMQRAGLQVTELSPQALQQFRESAQPVYDKMKSVVDERLLHKIFELRK